MVTGNSSGVNQGSTITESGGHCDSAVPNSTTITNPAPESPCRAARNETASIEHMLGELGLGAPGYSSENGNGEVGGDQIIFDV